MQELIALFIGTFALFHRNCFQSNNRNLNSICLYKERRKEYKSAQSFFFQFIQIEMFDSPNILPVIWNIVICK